MKKKHFLFKWVHKWVQSGIFGYNRNGTGNRVHTPLYIGGVPCTHLSTHFNSTHLIKHRDAPLELTGSTALPYLKNFFTLKIQKYD